jgi:hypothetical protein
LYALTTLVITVAVVLVIWPTSTDVPRWARSMSDELRFIAIAACGGALACSLKSTIGLLKRQEGPGSLPLKLGPPYVNLVTELVTLLLAVQLAIVAFIVVRSFVLLPTTPVSAFSPFGVLLLGSAAGHLAASFGTSYVSRLSSEIERPLTKRLDLIANAVGVAKLDNYEGNLCVSLIDSTGKGMVATGSTPDSSSSSTLFLKANERYALRAWFDPSAAGAGRSQAIRISGGQDVPQISFAVAADNSAGLVVAPGRQVFNFSPREKSDVLEFVFVAPIDSAPFRIWLRVTQKDRLVTVLAIESGIEAPPLAASTIEAVKEAFGEPSGQAATDPAPPPRGFNL